MSPPGLGKCNHIRHIVRLRQMLKRWRKAAASSRGAPPPSDVPAGHVAVCVGSSLKRYIVRATYLNHPVFKRLLVQAEEEYGFGHYSGPLMLPCDESFFEEILRVVSRSDSAASRFMNVEDFHRCCHVSMKGRVEVLGESWPLLNGVAADKSVY